MNKPRAYRTFRIVYAIITLNFVLPAISYIVAPETAIGTLERVNRALGGGPYPFVESGSLWHMLAVGNVMTLGFMCALLFVDLRRFYPVLPALAFLKAFSAAYATWIGLSQACPAFLGIGALDGSTTVAMVFFAVRARRALGDAPPPGASGTPWYVKAFLPGHARIEQSLERVRVAGIVAVTPTTSDIARGVLRMVHRLVFRSETVGTCTSQPVRATWRARLLRFRAVRIPFLLAERAIAPFDLSGLASPPERVIRHLLAAHHDGVQFAYDLELLALWPGRLQELHVAVSDVVLHDTRRARWLRDLVVFTGYHEALLAAVETVMRGDALLCGDDARNPDHSLRAYLEWCAATDGRASMAADGVEGRELGLARAARGGQLEHAGLVLRGPAQ
jgi:hypothetical protein